MPIVLKTVVVIDLNEAPQLPEHETRCDGCSQLLGSDAAAAVVRNRYGPAAVRTVHLCPTCRETLELQG